MSGLLDLFGGGGDGAGLYGDLLNPQQKEALAQRGLLGFLGGMQKSGALDYTAPFLSGKVPAGFAAGLAGGMAGMGEAQDQAGMNALRGILLGLQGKQLSANIDQMKAEQALYPKLLSGGTAAAPAAAPAAQSPSVTGPLALPDAAQASAATAAPDLGDGLRAGGALAGGILPALGQAVEQVESRGNPDAVSPAGAIGLRQIMPSTAAGYGVTDRKALFNPDTNRQLGDKILSDLLGRYNGDVDAALVAYNAGPGRADKWLAAGRDPGVLPAETQKYVPAVKAQLAQAQQGPLALPAQAPARGLLAMPAPGGAATPSPAPAASAGGGTAAGGALAPGGIDPRVAQAIALLRTGRGAAVAGFIDEAGKFPFVGPKAAAEQNARNQSDLFYKPQIEGGVRNSQNASDLFYKPQIEGSTETAKNPALIARTQAEQQAIGGREQQVAAFNAGLDPIRQRNEVLKKEYETNVVEPFNAAQKALTPLTAIENAMRQFQTGPTAESRLRAMRVIQDAGQMLGMDSGWAPKIAAGEVITKEGTNLGFELARTLGSREAQMIVQQAIASNPGLANSPGGNEKLIALIKTGLQRDIDKRSFVDDWFNKNLSYAGATEAFNKARPVEAYISQVLPFSAKTPQDAAKLPSGTRFIDPAGNIRVVP